MTETEDARRAECAAITLGGQPHELRLSLAACRRVKEKLKIDFFAGDLLKVKDDTSDAWMVPRLVHCLLRDRSVPFAHVEEVIMPSHVGALSAACLKAMSLAVSGPDGKKEEAVSGRPTEEPPRTGGGSGPSGASTSG